LREAGIASGSYYTTPLHRQPALRYLDVQEGSLPETERAAAENLVLPMWAGISSEQQERVVETVRSAVGVPA
jgi:dTDP-4-amino-4,6-dideoxygalactose transaminase